MSTSLDIQRRLDQLVATNRALASDLDVSRRMLADLGRERDTLARTARTLERAVQDARREAADAAPLRGELQELRSMVDLQRRHIESLSEQAADTEQLLERERHRVRAAEDGARRATRALHDMSCERDELARELADSLDAMDEIRDHLLARLGLEVDELRLG